MAEMKVGRPRKGGDSKKGKPRSAGRRGTKFHDLFVRMPERKLRRVLRRNGPVFAGRWAAAKNLLSALKRIGIENTVAGQVARDALRYYE